MLASVTKSSDDVVDDETKNRILAEVLPVILRNRASHSFLMHIETTFGSTHIGYVNPIYDGCGAFRILVIFAGKFSSVSIAPQMLKSDNCYLFPSLSVASIAEGRVHWFCEPASKELVSLCENTWIWSLPGFLTQEENDRLDVKFAEDMVAFRESLEDYDGML